MSKPVRGPEYIDTAIADICQHIGDRNIAQACETLKVLSKLNRADILRNLDRQTLELLRQARKIVDRMWFRHLDKVRFAKTDAERAAADIIYKLIDQLVCTLPTVESITARIKVRIKQSPYYRNTP